MNYIQIIVSSDRLRRLKIFRCKQYLNSYLLIKKTSNIIKIPILLNCFFNGNNQIVNISSEIINCLLQTKMNILLIENLII